MGRPEDTSDPPVGFAVPDWQPCAPPPRTAMIGEWCRVEPLVPDWHAVDLHAAFQADREGRIWTYLPYGPFGDLAVYRAWLDTSCQGDDPLFHAVCDKGSGRALGVASYLRVQPAVGVIEVGHICLSPALQRTPAATEAMAMMMGRAFDELGYRRYEWKCDALNAASMRAARRLGFRYEGTFRQATLYKGRNRDTAWFAVLDHEWPALREVFARWLDPANFDGQGHQRERLSALVHGTDRSGARA